MTTAAQPHPVTIALINASTVLTDAQVDAWVAPLTEQMAKDFYPHWGRLAAFDFVPKATRPPAGVVWAVVADNSDVAGALGYHDVTTTGQPLAYIFAQTAMAVGDSPLVTASHEICELLADEDIATCVEVGPLFYAREVCDACELDSQGYDVLGQRVSNFVFPRWFDANDSTPGPFDQCGLIKQPRVLLEGGYISVLDTRKVHDGWIELFGPSRRTNGRAVLQHGSRRARRVRKQQGLPIVRSTVATA